MMPSFGNKEIITSFSKTGELLRIDCKQLDYRQLLEFYHVGITVNDSNILYLHEDINNRYEQWYEKNTNVLHTKIENTYFHITVEQTDFVSMKKNLCIRQYVLENHNTIDLDIHMLIHSKLISHANDRVGSRMGKTGMVQYSHNYAVCTFSNQEMETCQLNRTEETIQSGNIQENDYIGMSTDSSVKYAIGMLHPGEKREFTVYLYINHNDQYKVAEELYEEVAELQKIDSKKELQSTIRYWKKYVQDHNTIHLQPTGDNAYDTKLETIYTRSILLFPLLINHETGGIAAAVEVDDNMEKSGGYGYCWLRDAVFVTKAFDTIDMHKETEKFYKIFCKNTQSKNGMWEQRFFTDGRLAPCWGLQVDETASVVYGVYEHYKVTKESKFLKDTLKMCENAMHFLERYTEQILDLKEEEDSVKRQLQEQYKDKKERIPDSFDIWENEEGIHTYTLASMYAAYCVMPKIYEAVQPFYENNRLKLEAMTKKTAKWNEYAEKIKQYVGDTLYDETYKILKRNQKDTKTDISTLGTVIPFHMFEPHEKKIQNTVEKINLTLRTYTGGYIRKEQDHYLNGVHPWPIATLWMALYYQEIGEKEKAKQCLDFVVNTSSPHGFLAEQVDNQTMQPIWVQGLCWSHAMFLRYIAISNM